MDGGIDTRRVRQLGEAFLIKIRCSLFLVRFKVVIPVKLCYFVIGYILMVNILNDEVFIIKILSPQYQKRIL